MQSSKSGSGIAARAAYAASTCLVVASVALFVTTPTASSDFNTAHYTFDWNSTCSNANEMVDPVNFVFFENGSGPNMIAKLEQVPFWLNNQGSGQFFSSSSWCGPMYGQRASDCIGCTRFHIRVRETLDDDFFLGKTGVGDAHHEDIICCPIPCHAVDKNGPSGSGFDWGRRELRTLFEYYGYNWHSEFWNNKRNFEQCDGDFAGSDGYTVFVRLPGVPTAVGLTTFNVRAGSQGVRILWRTASGLKAIGFNVWRYTEQVYRKLNAKLIPASDGGLGGHTYRYLDRGALAPKAYRYKLELIMQNGKRDWAGPVIASPATIPTVRALPKKWGAS